VERRGDGGAVAEIAPEIDEAVAAAEPRHEPRMEFGEPRRVAMDGGYRPEALRPDEPGEDLLGITRGGRCHDRPLITLSPEAPSPKARMGAKVTPRSASAPAGAPRYPHRSSRPRRIPAPAGRAPPDRSGARCRTAPAGRHCGRGRAPLRRSSRGRRN